jgi:ubiquitin-protein ligase
MRFPYDEILANERVRKMTWYENNPRRLLIEKKALEQSFPQFQFFKYGSELGVRGYLSTSRGGSYSLEIWYPNGFPNEAPRAYVLSPPILDAPHKFGTSQICVHYNEWRPQYTVAVMIGWAAHWLHSYEIWKSTGRWPGREI